ncbi:MAG: hypothetical protein NXH91_03370 [Phyllobacteriaceae bacterium]|jgi:hypothetical protein|nr:hypothetical protein [Phyllobacteriaceae bacterium]
MKEETTPSPYKGPSFFKLQDREFFFGRKRITGRILDMISARRVSMIHAASGSGKTSILRARILPELDNGGRDAIYCRPSATPSAGLRAATLMRILPPPGREALALEHAANACAERELRDPEDCSLAELREAYVSVPIQDSRHREMVREWDDGIPDLLKEEGAVHTAGITMIARLLTLQNGLALFFRYLLRLSKFAGRDKLYNLSGPDDVARLSVANVSSFLRRIDSQRYGVGIEQLLAKQGSLFDFFNVLTQQIAPDGAARPRGVLVLDQFEEFFTRFGDPGRGVDGATQTTANGTINYEIREKFFDELAEIVSRTPSRDEPSFRVCISIRGDYVARLGGFEMRCGAFLPSQKCEVPMLSPNDVGEIVQRPAVPFGMKFDREVIDCLRTELVSEARFVSPIQHQIVCEELWKQWTEHRSRPVAISDLVKLADNKAAPRLKKGRGVPPNPEDGVRSILSNYFESKLNELEENQQMDVLQVLSSMITFEGTREPVTYDRLLSGALVNKDTRRQVLRLLEERSIISRESIGGGSLVEIRHEFLILPIRKKLRELRNDHPSWFHFSIAMRAIERDSIGDLGRDQLDALCVHHEQIDREALSTWLGAELFRTCAVQGSGVDPKVYRSWLEVWSEYLVADIGTPLTASSLTKAAANDQSIRSVDLQAVQDWTFLVEVDLPARLYLVRKVITKVPSVIARPALKSIWRHGQFIH